MSEIGLLWWITICVILFIFDVIAVVIAILEYKEYKRKIKQLENNLDRLIDMMVTSGAIKIYIPTSTNILDEKEKN